MVSNKYVHMDGGVLYVWYPPTGVWLMLGASEREVGATLKFGEKKMKRVMTEGDTDEAAYEWSEGQDITFETEIVTLGTDLLKTVFGDRSAWSDTSKSPNFKAAFWFGSISDGVCYDLTMHNAEIASALDLAFKDMSPTTIKLVLRLKKATTGIEIGGKFFLTRYDVPSVADFSNTPKHNPITGQELLS